MDRALRGRRGRRRRDSDSGDSVRHRPRRRSGCASAIDWGAKFSIVVVAEGAYAKGGKLALLEEAHPGFAERLGGIGAQVSAALSAATGKETRSVVLGHLQRGGAPTSFDRVLATRFGGKAVELARQGQFGTMVASDPPDIVARSLEDIVGKTKTVPMDSDLLATAKAFGVSFGD